MVKGAGHSTLEAIPEELWDQLEMMIKAKKINKQKKESSNIYEFSFFI
jgi:hypothetical protein